MKDSRNIPKLGDILKNRFELLESLGQGAFASVWLASDLETKRKLVLKIYIKDALNVPLAQYHEYLTAIRKKLTPYHLTSIRLPEEMGEIDGYIYEVSTYLEGFRSLNQVLSEFGPLHPRDALSILSKIAEAVAVLQQNSVIHADLKPENILVSDSSEREVRVIDFGMVQPVETEETFLVFSTYRYMHPELAKSTRDLDKSTTSRARLRAAAIGPYIDLYAIGIISLELFVADPKLPRPLSQASIAALLKDSNPWLHLSEDSKVNAVANLVTQLLTVGPRAEIDIAQTIGTLSRSLISEFPEDTPRAIEVMSRITSGKKQPKAALEVKTAVYDIAHLSKQLAEYTAAFILKSGAIETVYEPQEDNEVLEKVNSVFRNAIKRARTSWRLGVAMTITSFVLLVSMIVSAITLTVVTGELQWAFIFGGLSVSTVIGTLIWRPYDRLFRATILTQQIEMIHIQTVAGFRGTSRVNDRMRICSDAVVALRTLLEPKGKE
jgi:serine/threonine protein kinase